MKEKNKMNWEFKKDAEPQGSSDGFWYDINWGGYIRVEELLESPEQIKAVKDAVKLLRSFEQAMEEAELLIEF